MSTFKVEETVMVEVKRIYFVDAETSEEAIHRVMSNKKDVDEEYEVDEEEFAEEGLSDHPRCLVDLSHLLQLQEKEERANVSSHVYEWQCRVN